MFLPCLLLRYFMQGYYQDYETKTFAIELYVFDLSLEQTSIKQYELIFFMSFSCDD